jgi:hypothetical protein
MVEDKNFIVDELIRLIFSNIIWIVFLRDINEWVSSW